MIAYERYDNQIASVHPRGRAARYENRCLTRDYHAKINMRKQITL